MIYCSEAQRGEGWYDEMRRCERTILQRSGDIQVRKGGECDSALDIKREANGN